MTLGSPDNPGRASRTRCQLLGTGVVAPVGGPMWRSGSYNGKPASLVELEPLTGRRHQADGRLGCACSTVCWQLRLHCGLLGHKIVGDYTYGAE